MNRAAVSVMMILLATGCSSAPIASPSPTVTPTASPSQTVTPGVTVAASPVASPATLRQLVGHVVGTYAVDKTYPAYSVEAPRGWSSNGAFVLQGPIGLSVWDVVTVPTDPCRWQSTMTTPGPTVDDLVQALVAQKTRNATTPTAVTLAGHTGMYLEWSVPDDPHLRDDCDKWPDNGVRDFVSFLGVGGSERYHDDPTNIDRLWVLDVNGQRLLVDATYYPSTSEVQRAELDQIAESLRFDEP